MKIGKRGQVTIPKELRERFSLAPGTDVDFQVIRDMIILKKAPNEVGSPNVDGSREEQLR